MAHITNSVKIFLLILIVTDGLQGALLISQEPSFVRGLTGQSASFNCSYSADQEKIFRSVVYWALKVPGRDPTVIHPESPPRYRGRLTVRPNSGDGLFSLLVRPLRLNDTETYYCYISFVVDGQSITKEGDGTRLFVHDPLVLTPPSNRSYDARRQRAVSCETRLPGGAEAQIVWLRNGALATVENRSVSLTPASDGSLRVLSRLALPSPAQDTKVTYTCLLNHSSAGAIDSRQYVVVGESHRHPVLLYALILMNSVAVLLVVIAFGLKKPLLCRPAQSKPPYRSEAARE